MINFDPTDLNIVPTSNWTLAEKGAKQVEIVGLGDKCKVKLLLACSLTCELLPF
jgi:hypothetical protein